MQLNSTDWLPTQQSRHRYDQPPQNSQSTLEPHVVQHRLYIHSNAFNHDTINGSITNQVPRRQNFATHVSTTPVSKPPHYAAVNVQGRADASKSLSIGIPVYSSASALVPHSVGSRDACFNCGLPGHWAQFCSEPRRVVPAGVIPIQNAMPSHVRFQQGSRYHKSVPHASNASPCLGSVSSGNPFPAPSMWPGPQKSFTQSHQALSHFSLPNDRIVYGLPTPVSPANSAFHSPVDLRGDSHTSSYPTTPLLQQQQTIHNHNFCPDRQLNVRHFQHTVAATSTPSEGQICETTTIATSEASSGLDLISDELEALDFPEDDQCLERDCASAAHVAKPLASTMEVADLEAPLPFMDSRYEKCVSKYFQSPHNADLLHRNISETPLWHLYRTDPVFAKISPSENVRTFQELITHRDTVLLQSKALPHNSYKPKVQLDTEKITHVESEAQRLEREREETLARLGVSGQPKPVIPFHRPAYNPLPSYSASETQVADQNHSDASQEEGHKALRAQEARRRLNFTSTTAISKPGLGITRRNFAPPPPSPPPITRYDHPNCDNESGQQRAHLRRLTHDVKSTTGSELGRSFHNYDKSSDRRQQRTHQSRSDPHAPKTGVQALAGRLFSRSHEPRQKLERRQNRPFQKLESPYGGNNNESNDDDVNKATQNSTQSLPNHQPKRNDDLATQLCEKESRSASRPETDPDDIIVSTQLSKHKTFGSENVPSKRQRSKNDTSRVYCKTGHKNKRERQR